MKKLFPLTLMEVFGCLGFAMGSFTILDKLGVELFPALTIPAFIFLQLFLQLEYTGTLLREKRNL